MKKRRLREYAEPENAGPENERPSRNAVSLRTGN